MQEKVSQIVNRARGLSDIVNSQWMTYNDIISSLKESWRDLYELITESSDDYFVNVITLDLVKPSGVPLNVNEYIIDLPDDFYKLDFLDYSVNGVWRRMTRFPKDARGDIGNEPRYRFQGNQLWVVGQNWGGTSQLRMGYYPVQDDLYFPAQGYLFDTELSDASIALITAIEYIPGRLPTTFDQDVNPAQPGYNGIAFNVSGVGLYFTSNVLGTTTQILESTASITQIRYYKGFLYWIQDSDLYGAPFDPSSPATVTGVQMTSSADIVWILPYRGTMYLSVGGVTSYATIPSTPATIAPSAVTSPYTPPSGALGYYPNFNGLPMWMTSGGDIYVNDVQVASGYSSIQTDGNYLYVTDSSYDLTRLTIDVSDPTAPVLDVAEILAEDILLVGAPSLNWIPTVGYESLVIEAKSTIPDYEFTYPNNLAYEIMSLQIAIDCKRKQGANEQVDKFNERKVEIVTRFMAQLSRDSYSPERIGPSYTTRGGNLFPGA